MGQTDKKNIKKRKKKLIMSFIYVPRAFCLIRNNENVCSNQKNVQNCPIKEIFEYYIGLTRLPYSSHLTLRVNKAM